MDLYKEAVREERNIQPLSDDYVKFLRLGHFVIECTAFGVLSLITNHTYLTGVIHRGLREQLLKAFDAIDVLDLHGSALLGLRSPDGEIDKNVFDIQQGVSVATLVRRGGCGAFGRLRRADLWGLREYKYQVLLGELPLPKPTPVVPTRPFFFFTASNAADEIYKMGISVASLFKQCTAGFVTGRDEALISLEREPLVALGLVVRQVVFDGLEFGPPFRSGYCIADQKCSSPTGREGRFIHQSRLEGVLGHGQGNGHGQGQGTDMKE